MLMGSTDTQEILAMNGSHMVVERHSLKEVSGADALSQGEIPAISCSSQHMSYSLNSEYPPKHLVCNPLYKSIKEFRLWLIHG